MKSLLRRLLGSAFDKPRPGRSGQVGRWAGLVGANDQVRAQLALQGDDGSGRRHVVHYAYPGKHGSSLPKGDVVAMLRQYDVQMKDSVAYDGLVFEHQRDVAPGDFDDLTNRLSVNLAAAGWEYDGWECAVVPKES